MCTVSILFFHKSYVNRKQTLIIIRFIAYAIPLYYQWNEFKVSNDRIDGTIRFIRNVQTDSVTDGCVCPLYQMLRYIVAI